MDQEIVAPNSTNSNSNNNTNNLSKPFSSSSSFERNIRPQKDDHVNCPRCDSTNTKFCYYNNYSLSMPRYFCKTCRRYWTEGGTLRNIPVGGGSRKNKRSSSSSSSYQVTKKLPHDLFVPPASTSVPSQNPRMHHHHGQGHYGQDLNLGFPLSSTTNNSKNVYEFLQVPNNLASATTTTGSAQFLAAMNSFMRIPMMPEFKIPTSIGFSLDGMNGNGVMNGNGRVLFPFEEMKVNTERSHDDDDDHGGQSRDDEDQDGDSNGHWNGMLGGGSW